MFSLKKTLFGIVTLIIVFCAGIILLIKGCLAKYDERSAMLPAIAFTKNDSPYVFSIVQFAKTVSYEQNGGFVHKVMNTSYSIQCNDGYTGKITGDRKIKNHRDIKSFPVEILGLSPGKVWVFIGEPLVFDPYTLQQIADTKTLEQKNPALAGKFPKERRFYDYNKKDNHIYFTASDGTRWRLNASDFSIKPDDISDKDDIRQTELEKIETLQKQNETTQDSNFQQYYRVPMSLFSQRKISSVELNRSLSVFNTNRDQLYRIRDSLRNAKRNIENIIRDKEQLERAVHNLDRLKPSYYSIKSNMDSLQGKWYGLYSEEEFSKLYDHFQYNSENGETARRKLFTAGFTKNTSDDLVIDKKNGSPVNNDYYLHGGFLLDKNTAMPIHYNNGWLVISKEQIGNDGKIIIHHIDFSGRHSWSFNTELNEWLDWDYTANMLFVFGVDNKNISGHQANVLLCIDLKKGKAAKYDYMNPD